jgi:two-component system sensor histidine kinase AlgZ
VFDACNAGVVLRAVLFVQVVVSTAAIYGADSLWEWFSSAALLTGACLPGTLVWLIAACSLKHQLQRLGTRGQYLAGVLLGALQALRLRHAVLHRHAQNPWLASAAVTGGLLAALVTALRARARQHAGADPGPPHRAAVTHQTALSVQHPQQRDCAGAPNQPRPKPCSRISATCFAMRWPNPI